MDSVELENVKKFLSHTGMFYNLVQSMLEEGRDQQEIIKMLRNQFDGQRRILEDFGINEQDEKTVKIRKLNQQIRELEQARGEDTTISWEDLGRYIYTKNQQLEQALEKLGLNCSVGLSVNGGLEASICVFPLYNTPISDFAKTEEEKSQRQIAHEEQIVTMMKNFNTSRVSSRTSECVVVLHTQENIEKIHNVFETVLDVSVSQSSYVTRIEGENELSITDMKISATLLNQFRNLNEAMRERF